MTISCIRVRLDGASLIADSAETLYPGQHAVRTAQIAQFGIDLNIAEGVVHADARDGRGGLPGSLCPNMPEAFATTVVT